MLPVLPDLYGGNRARENSALKENLKEMAKTNIALQLQRRMVQLETDLDKKNEENAKFNNKLEEIFYATR